MVKKYYGYIGPNEDPGRCLQKPGRNIGGVAIGIIRMGCSNIVFFPGNISNASSFQYPVHYVFAEGADQAGVHLGDRQLLASVISCAKDLEAAGCRAVFASCGYFGNYQKEASDAVDIPVYLSSLIQIPFILRGLKRSQSVGILCSDAPNLSESMFRSCGISEADQERCLICGAENLPEFQNVLSDAGSMDSRKAQQELTELACSFTALHPEIGALLLECTEMPPSCAATIDATMASPKPRPADFVET